MITVNRHTGAGAIASLNEELQNYRARLLPEIFKPYNPKAAVDALDRLLQQPGSYCYVAADENENLIGYVICCIVEGREDVFRYGSKTMVIDQIIVQPKRRKSGAGTQLLDVVERLARELGIAVVELDFWSANAVASSFFRTHEYSLYRERLCKKLF